MNGHNSKLPQGSRTEQPKKKNLKQNKKQTDPLTITTFLNQPTIDILIKRRKGQVNDGGGGGGGKGIGTKVEQWKGRRNRGGILIDMLKR